MTPSLRIHGTAALCFLFASQPFVAHAKTVQTNAVTIPDAPNWLTASMVEISTDKVQRFLEWDIRRIQVKWYQDQADFQRAHGFGDSVLAYASKSQNSVHVGPGMNSANFKTVFGHELAHIILYQKYKDAIPKWLEEGLANFAAKHGHLDYAWLTTQPARDVRTMKHPYDAVTSGATRLDRVRYHYMASTALMEMIATKCSISDLLQLSVGKKLETYLKTFCGIHDLNADFRKWITRKSGTSSSGVLPSPGSSHGLGPYFR